MIAWETIKAPSLLLHRFHNRNPRLWLGENIEKKNLHEMSSDLLAASEMRLPSHFFVCEPFFCFSVPSSSWEAQQTIMEKWGKREIFENLLIAFIFNLLEVELISTDSATEWIAPRTTALEIECKE